MNWIKKEQLTGYLLIIAACGFAISWFLIPDPGTTDTLHILSIVKQARTEVLYSVILQIASSILYIVTLFIMMRNRFIKKITVAGMILLGIGAMGFCADAFFHLLAYGMTGNLVTTDTDIIRVMEFMQTVGAGILVPLLLSFFIGSMMMAAGLKKQGLISSIPQGIFFLAMIIGIVFMILSAMSFQTGSIPLMIIIDLYAIGQVWIGYEMTIIDKQTDPVFLEYRIIGNLKTEAN